MMKRGVVEIDEDRCNGCGLCIPNCHEGALQIVHGKAKLVKESYCDGLGNCLGNCPQDAIKIVKKDVEEFDLKETNQHLKEIGKPELDYNPLEDKHAHQHQEDLPCGCPGTMVQSISKQEAHTSETHEQASELTQWPIQLHLVPTNAPFFQDSDLLIAADCVGFANPNFHSKLLKGKAIAIGCPKLDSVGEYFNKLKIIFKENDIKSVTVAIMEVPCCSGLHHAVESALEQSGKNIKLKSIVVKIDGSIDKY